MIADPTRETAPFENLPVSVQQALVAAGWAGALCWGGRNVARIFGLRTKHVTYLNHEQENPHEEIFALFESDRWTQRSIVLWPTGDQVTAWEWTPWTTPPKMQKVTAEFLCSCANQDVWHGLQLVHGVIARAMRDLVLTDYNLGLLNIMRCAVREIGDLCATCKTDHFTLATWESWQRALTGSSGSPGENPTSVGLLRQYVCACLRRSVCALLSLAIELSAPYRVRPQWSARSAFWGFVHNAIREVIQATAEDLRVQYPAIEVVVHLSGPSVPPTTQLYDMQDVVELRMYDWIHAGVFDGD